MAEDKAIRVEGLTKCYGDLIAVNSISFTIDRGEIFAFLGPNGAGKTVTVEMLECLRKPTSGKAFVLGFDIAKDQMTIKKKTGVLPQDFYTYERLTVKETIEYYAGMFNSHPDVEGLIKLVDLEDKRNVFFKHLSGGLKQRLGIAVALVNNPELIFLDEPSAGLDPKARHGVWHLIEGLHRERKTIFLTTHYMEEAEVLAGRVGIIHNGKIVAMGSPQGLISEYGKRNLLILKKTSSKAVPNIEKLGIRASYDQATGDVIVHLNHSVNVSDVLHSLSSGGIPFGELQLKRSSLEDVFLNLTGESLGEEEDDNMSHIVIDLKASVRSFTRNKSTIFWTIAFPSVLILLFGAIFSYSSVKYDLYLQNQDLVDGRPTYWSGSLIDVLNSSGIFNIQTLNATVNATDYAISNRLSSLLIIPSGFNDSANMAVFTHTPALKNVTFVYDQSTSSAPIVGSIVKSIIENINFQLSRGVNYLNVQELTIAPKRYSYIDFFLPGMIGVTAMTTSIFTSVSISAQFKQNGVFHKLATTPLKRYEWILSRTVYNVLITFLGMAVMIVLGVAVFGMKMTIDVISLFMVTMASLMFTGLGMIIARFVRDPDGADAAANVITFPMMFLSGTFFPLSQMPLFLQTIARVLPLTYVSDGLRASMIFGQSQTAIFNTVLIAALGLVSIAIGSWITKWEED